MPWEETNFAQLWVNLHQAQAAHAHKNDAGAKGLIGSIRQNQAFLLAPHRMKDYPAQLESWVEGSVPEVDKLAKALKK